MNKEIAWLGLKSYLLNYVDNETPRRYFINGNADIEEVELFAELIIKECIKLIEPNGEHRTEPNSYLGGQEGVELLDTNVEYIKQHFGIKDE